MYVSGKNGWGGIIKILNTCPWQERWIMNKGKISYRARIIYLLRWEWRRWFWSRPQCWSACPAGPSDRPPKRKCSVVIEWISQRIKSIKKEYILLPLKVLKSKIVQLDGLIHFVFFIDLTLLGTCGFSLIWIRTGIYIMQNTMVRGGGNGQPGKKWN